MNTLIIEARKYAKYLKNKNADALIDINNFYKDTFKNVNTDAKIKQKLSQRDITIANLRCQLQEEKNLRKSLMNTIEKDTNTKIKELTSHLEKEMNRENDFQQLLINYNKKLEEAQQTIEQQKQLLTFYEAEKQSIHYGFNKVIEYNEDCSKDIKVVKDKKKTANKTKREKTEKKKEKPEIKLDTPPINKPEIKEEKKEIVVTETEKPILYKKIDTPLIIDTDEEEEEEEIDDQQSELEDKKLLFLKILSKQENMDFETLIKTTMPEFYKRENEKGRINKTIKYFDKI